MRWTRPFAVTVSAVPSNLSKNSQVGALLPFLSPAFQLSIVFSLSFLSYRRGRTPPLLSTIVACQGPFRVYDKYEKSRTQNVRPSNEGFLFMWFLGYDRRRYSLDTLLTIVAGHPAKECQMPHQKNPESSGGLLCVLQDCTTPRMEFRLSQNGWSVVTRVKKSKREMNRSLSLDTF